MERRLLRGPTLGRSNRGAPRGARAHKQPDSASDARQHNAAAKLATRSRLPSEPTSKSGLFRVSFGGGFSAGHGGGVPAAAVVGGCGISAARFVEPCGNHRWTLRRSLRQRSWEHRGSLRQTSLVKSLDAAASLRRLSFGKSLELAATVVGASLTNR